jgi:hypothetical protein
MSSVLGLAEAEMWKSGKIDRDFAPSAQVALKPTLSI